MHRKLLTAVLVVGTALTLTACVPDDPAPTPVPSPSRATPLFATDEEAVAAAEKVYREYLAVVEDIMEGTRPADEVELTTAGEFAHDEKQGLLDFVSEGNVTQGSSALKSFVLQQVLSSPDSYTVIAYACEDISAVSVLDSAGRSLVSDSRPPINLLEVTLQANEDEELRIVARELVGTEC